MMIELKYATSQQWVDAVLADFDGFLLDHAACERKASGLALSLLAHYPDRQHLVDQMLDIAIEELQHFKQVMQYIKTRGLMMRPDQKDPYIHGLKKHIRHGTQAYLDDRLLLASIIEARGHERFELIAQALPEGELQRFYKAISRSEARHFAVFLNLAIQYGDENAIHRRLTELLQLESQLVKTLPIRAALH